MSLPASLAELHEPGKVARSVWQLPSAPLWNKCPVCDCTSPCVCSFPSYSCEFCQGWRMGGAGYQDGLVAAAMVCSD